MATYYGLLASSNRAIIWRVSKIGENATWYLDNCLGQALVVSNEEGEDEGDVGGEHHLLDQSASHQKCDLGEGRPFY